ncbi:major facilitator superfamily transporter [Fusarium sp. NRRL 25303]|nr:major facilitator superfamily transporter [Fusarium sp. NRRL 25303]
MVSVGCGLVLAAQLVGPMLSGELVRSSVWMPLFLSWGLVLGGGIILVSLTPETLKLRQPREEVSVGPYDYGLESNMLSLEPPKRTSVMVTFKSMFSRPLLWPIPGAVMTIPLLGHTSHTMHTATRHHMFLEQTHTFANSSQMLNSSSRELVAILSWLPLHDDGNKGSLHHCRPSRVGTGLGSIYALPRHVSWDDRGGESRDAIRAAGGL